MATTGSMFWVSARHTHRSGRGLAASQAGLRITRCNRAVTSDPLRDPAHWRTIGLDADKVEIVETHCAWVYLAGGQVLKRKKPMTLWSTPLHAVRFKGARREPLADFATPDRREQACREEVRLNRRLAPDVYVGVLMLRERHAVRPILARDPLEVATAERRRGDDWLVWMRRLPEGLMLDQRLRHRPMGRHAVTPSAIDGLGEVLGRLWRSGAVDAPRAEAHLCAMAVEHETDAAVLTHPRLGLQREAMPLLRPLDRLRIRLDRALRDRASSGALRDGHGDLRPEHIALLDPPRVIDALEFDAALRTQDPFEELAFLGLECERLGAAWIGARLMAHWSTTSREPVPGELMPLYTARRALLRARLALAHLLDPEVRHPQRWLPLARWYLQRAEAALKGDAPVLAAGVPGQASTRPPQRG